MTRDGGTETDASRAVVYEEAWRAAGGDRERIAFVSAEARRRGEEPDALVGLLRSTYPLRDPDAPPEPPEPPPALEATESAPDDGPLEDF